MSNRSKGPDKQKCEVLKRSMSKFACSVPVEHGLTLCLLQIVHAFLSSADFFQNQLF